MRALIILFLLLAVLPVNADGYYAGLKAGQIEVDGVAVDTDTGFGAQVGYQISPAFALEADLLAGTGEVLNLDVALDTLGLYGVYRSSGRYFFLARLGALAKKVEVENVPSRDQQNTRWSGGIGFGFRPTEKLQLELEYTRFDSDLDYTGINFSFLF